MRRKRCRSTRFSRCQTQDHEDHEERIRQEDREGFLTGQKPAAGLQGSSRFAGKNGLTPTVAGLREAGLREPELPTRDVRFVLR